MPDAINDPWAEPSTQSAPPGFGERQRPQQADDPQLARRPARHRPMGTAHDGGFPGAAPGDPPDLFRQDFGQQEYGQQDYAGSGFSRDDIGRRGQAQRGRSQQERPEQNFSQQRPVRADRGYPDTDLPDSNRGDRRSADPDYAARMDPALRDFFAPQAGRPEAAEDRYVQQGHGAQRSGVRGYPGQGAGPGTGQGRGQVQGPGQFQGPGRGPAEPPGWDARLERPGPRSARRQEGGTGSRGRMLAVVGVAVVLVIAVVAYLVTRGSGNSGTTAQTTPTATPTPSVHATKAARAATSSGSAMTATGYILTTPAVAAGYHQLTPIPTGVQTAIGSISQAIHTTAANSGGKITSQVSAAYQLSGGQVLAFTGFDGTFNPAKVAAGLAGLGTDENVQSAGPHGGTLACATVPGTQPGTACVWVTTTTIGVTEFFSSVGPEVVTMQAKAASDTVKFRDSVEVAKG